MLTINNEQLDLLYTFINDNDCIKLDEPLSNHCTLKIGGPADVFIEPTSQSELISVLDLCISHQISYIIIGKGSNLLISDEGFRGVVIATNRLIKLSKDENYISAYTGVLLKDLCEYAMNEGLSGLEFASGIPGSVGGAVFMNAGAYGGEIKDVLYCSKALVPNLSVLRSKNPILHIKRVDHDFSYRNSSLQQNGLIHLSSVFELNRDDPASIKDRMTDLDKQRNEKQPMEKPSAGSIFKRPQGYYTGKLIDDCGLRGYQIGGAAISNKHCGFIVNQGNASAMDVVNLIKLIRKEVYAKFGVILETEIKFIGINEK